MAKYRLTKGTHSALVGAGGGKEGKRVEYRAGVEGQDVMELTDAQAALPHLRKRIEKVHEEGGAVDQPAPLQFVPDDDQIDEFKYHRNDRDEQIEKALSGNIDQALKFIEKHENDLEILEAARTAEASDKKRKGVLDKLDELLGE